MMKVRRASLAALLTLLVACSTSHSARGRSPIRNAGSQGAAAVLQGEELEAATRMATRLTDVLASRIPGLRVIRSAGISANCPMLVFRGTRSFQDNSQAQADLYIDGNLAKDGCVLDTIPPRHVAGIEVYAGHSPPDNIPLRPNAAGIVLIATRRR